MIQDSDMDVCLNDLHTQPFNATLYKVNTGQYGKREKNSEFTTISLIFTLVQDYNQVSGKLIHACHIFM